MNVLCDTNVFIKLFRGDQEVISRLGEIGSENVLMPVITAMELFSGVQNKKDLQRMKREISSYNIFQLDERSSKISLELLENYRLSHGLQIPDALIASMAIAHNIELYTYNLKDFQFLPEIRLHQGSIR